MLIVSLLVATVILCGIPETENTALTLKKWYLAIQNGKKIEHTCCSSDAKKKESKLHIIPGLQIKIYSDTRYAKFHSVLAISTHLVDATTTLMDTKYIYTENLMT